MTTFNDSSLTPKLARTFGIAVIVLLTTLTACGSGDAASDDKATTTTAATIESESDQTGTDADEDAGNEAGDTDENTDGATTEDGTEDDSEVVPEGAALATYESAKAELKDILGGEPEICDLYEATNVLGGLPNARPGAEQEAAIGLISTLYSSAADILERDGADAEPLRAFIKKLTAEAASSGYKTPLQELDILNEELPAALVNLEEQLGECAGAPGATTGSTDEG